MIGRVLAAVAGLFLAAGSAGAAECVGRDLIAALPPEGRAQLAEAGAGVPYAEGLLWQATKGRARLVLAGTYHFPDPRHETLMARLRPEIDGAARLLVEAGPEEAATLKAALARDPALISDTSGPTLPERLDGADWTALSEAMAARGVPAVVASRLRPWYVATLLGLSPCMMAQAAEAGEVKGLDHLLMDEAAAAGVPVAGLEPWDTLFRIFEGMSEAEEIDMIRAALPAAGHADDYATTLMNAYFAGKVWEIWEFGRLDALASGDLTEAEVDAQMRLAQDRLMDRRNAAWIAPLTAAAEAAAPKPVVAAFGALHLPGERGVLRLLEADGWAVAPLAR